MNILIAGGSGFLGQALTQFYQTKGDTVSWVSSNPYNVKHSAQKNNVTNVHSYDALPDNNAEQENCNIHYDVVINLAGAAIADKRWSKKRKQLLYTSRINSTKKLVHWLNKQEHKPSQFISGSAIGWYGVQDNNVVLNEKSKPVDGFQHVLCDQWEQTAHKAEDITTTIVRTGVVLDKSGGMLKKLILPFSLCLGGRLGNGSQMLSWISLYDWIHAVDYLVTNRAEGTYNLTAPIPVSNNEFTQTFAKSLNRFAVLPAPAFALKLLLGEMSELLLKGQKVIPQKLLNDGFSFKHKTLDIFFEDNG